MKYVPLSFLFFLLTINTFGFQNPKANSKAVIVSGQARFTVLTPRVIRMEWDNDSNFEDKASFVVINRNTAVPKYTVKEKSEWLVIETKVLQLRYRKNSGQFTDQNLQITFKSEDKKGTWTPGIENKENLLGTTRTLDGCDGGLTWDGTPITLEQGILSRAGWYLLDDSKSFLFDNEAWNWVTTRKALTSQDWYFFGYGLDYKKALSDYTLIAGKIPLPPRYAFGYWWSRYWAYSDSEFKALVNDFRTYDIPIDVLVIDMDWHLTHGGLKNIKNPQRDPFGELLGWTGYTWNKALFPEPARFIDWTNKEKLKTALNLHPASGIAPMESQYQEFAKQYDFDTSRQNWIPYRMADKQWAKTYFDVLLKPYEEWGVDFWWLDWQQFPESKVVEGLNNTWWLNYTFFSSMAQRTGTRPLLFHRWGGLGNHRYQIGFSGDYKISWPSLQYQSYFTHTASNVGYGYWSHDIGGHASGDLDRDAELYTRWLQFGIFSPILRTHSAKISSIERRFWMFPNEFQHMRELIKLRYALAPYTYTMARKAYDHGIAICRPMYYDYPKEENAYKLQYQYMFGDQMLFTPVAEPVGKDLVAEQHVWLPEGNWFEWSSGAKLKGGNQIVKRNYMLEELPLFVKEGSIIPMYPGINNLQEIPDKLMLTVFPGKRGSFDLYEDHGDTEDYKTGSFSITKLTQEEKKNQKTITVSAAKGTYKSMPKNRSLEIKLPVSFPPASISVNGETLKYNETGKENSWTYDGQELATSIYIPSQPVSKPLTVTITYPKDYMNKKELLYGKPGVFKRLKKIIGLMKIEIARENWWALLSNVVFAAEQVPVNISYNPEKIMEQLKLFEKNYDTMLKDMRMHRDARKVITKNILVPLEQ